MVVLDIDHYTTQIAPDCSGTGCIGKVANIIGFFVEGMSAKTSTLDASMPACDDPDRDIVTAAS